MKGQGNRANGKTNGVTAVPRRDPNHSRPIYKTCLICCDETGRATQEHQPVFVDTERRLTRYRCTNCNHRIEICHDELDKIFA